MNRLKIVFQLTLFKKVFLLLMMSFTVINLVNIYLDFEVAKNNQYKLLENQYLKSIVNNLGQTFYEKYNKIDDDFFNEVTTTFSKDMYAIDTVLILDKNGQVVYDKSKYWDTILKTSNRISEGDQLFKLNSLDKTIRKEFENYILENFDGISFPLQIAYDKSQENKKDNEYEETYIDNIYYLSVNNYVFYDKRVNNEVIETQYFESYFCQDFYSYTYANGPYETIGDNILKYSMIKESIVENLRHSMTEDDSQFNWYEQGRRTFTDEENMYLTYFVPLVNKDLSSNEGYDKDDILGYLAVYFYEPNGVNKILNDVSYAKIDSYIISFILAIITSLFISYMLTRRIKRINNATQYIANNQFDIQLNERSYDELGTLSHNINSMSQQLKQTMDQLKNEIDHVKHLESIRKEFIANFTHEIKTPLGIINGYIELIQEVKDEDKKQKYLDAIDKETERINELVLAMLNLSRLESGSVELKIEDIDLEDLIASIVDSFSSLLKKKNILIDIQGEESIIKGDVFEMQMVIKNFLSNAIKHTPKNKHIYIVYNEDIISIENEGEFISGDQMNRIWDTYVSSDHEGTGLGLAICKTILDLHHYGYYVENTSRGVKFTITINKKSC